MEPYRAPRDSSFGDYGRQSFISAREDNVSTFSLDTDRTSYQLALNWARNGYEIDPSSVRAEEWVNAFNYNYDLPRNDREFAVTSEVIRHPLDDDLHLARVSFQAPVVPDDTPLNVTLVLDASGSMRRGNRVDIAREAAEAIRESLGPRDRIAVVHFTNNVIDEYTIYHSDPDEGDAAWSISRLAPHDSTNVQAGLNLGVRLADQARRERPDAHNYIILMSDGVANVDATDPFSILESAHDRDSRNPLRIIAVGVGIENYNDYLLEQLAQHGNGWYRYLQDAEQARATFSRENWLAISTPFADQTRAQVNWDTDVVDSWRIVGYENRVTPDETFTQDRKEFAELPSGTATTVFYELDLRRDGNTDRWSDLGDVELRWVEPGSGESRSQHANVSGRLSASIETVRDPLLRFGVVVGLAADRYSSLDEGYSNPAWVSSDLRTLNDLLATLREELGGLQAYEDVRFLMEHMLGSIDRYVPLPTPPTGYSS
ncbi:MAG: von Willebrand factor type A domain-containing protein [Dehalococcoidia bacterium]|nr:von Willebrand factor type A domain-containing protein [Dehalococcoidia bacterium]